MKSYTRIPIPIAPKGKKTGKYSEKRLSNPPSFRKKFRFPAMSSEARTIRLDFDSKIRIIKTI
jgi:hypothetical protein